MRIGAVIDYPAHKWSEANRFNESWTSSVVTQNPMPVWRYVGGL